MPKDITPLRIAEKGNPQWWKSYRSGAMAGLAAIFLSGMLMIRCACEKGNQRGPALLHGKYKRRSGTKLA